MFRCLLLVVLSPISSPQQGSLDPLHSPHFGRLWTCPMSPGWLCVQVSSSRSHLPHPHIWRVAPLSASGSTSRIVSWPASLYGSSSSTRRPPTPGCSPRTTWARRPGSRRWSESPCRSRSRRKIVRCWRAGWRICRRKAESDPKHRIIWRWRIQ